MRTAAFALCCSCASLVACSTDDSLISDDAAADVTTGDAAVDISREDAQAETTTSADTTPDIRLDRGTDTATDAPSDAHGGATEGSICPMPTNTGTVDVSALACADLATQYAEAVNNAHTCGCDGDCSVKVCATFCCNCETFINPGSDAYAAITSIKAAWTTKGCAPDICPKVLCADASLLGCTADGSDSGKACVTAHGI